MINLILISASRAKRAYHVIVSKFTFSAAIQVPLVARKGAQEDREWGHTSSINHVQNSWYIGAGSPATGGQVIVRPGRVRRRLVHNLVRLLRFCDANRSPLVKGERLVRHEVNAVMSLGPSKSHWMQVSVCRTP